jgi:hypothetical protein
MRGPHGYAKTDPGPSKRKPTSVTDTLRVGAIEQPHPETLLQLPHRMAQRGRRDTQPRRARKLN